MAHKVMVGSAVSQGQTWVDQKFWSGWGPLVDADGARTIVVEFDPPIEVPSLQSIVDHGATPSHPPNINMFEVTSLTCIEGDAAGYGWGVHCRIGGLECWLDDTQAAFATTEEALRTIWDEAAAAMVAAGAIQP